jgi:hypothetical protein
MEIDPSVALVGDDRVRSLQGIFVATGSFVLVLAVSFLPFVPGAIIEPGLVVLGFGLAIWWAYDNSGLAVSVALVGAPVVARLTYYWWLYLDEPSPVALPLSFEGSGAWELWIPLALLLGVIAFGVGVSLRWTRLFIAGKPPSLA